MDGHIDREDTLLPWIFYYFLTEWLQYFETQDIVHLINTA